jgi:hypothetical protein
MTTLCKEVHMVIEDAKTKEVNTAFGYCLNVFPADTSSNLDIFIIFNEPNDEPTKEEIDIITDTIKKILKTNKKLDLNMTSEVKIYTEILRTKLNCIRFGFQVVLKNFRP